MGTLQHQLIFVAATVNFWGAVITGLLVRIILDRK